MSEQIAVARINRTGALIRLHDGNRGILSQRGVVETTATADSKTGRLVETGGADRTAVIAASKDLTRIGEALEANKRQRELLLTAALKMPGAEEYLISLEVYEGSEDNQYIDPDTLSANNAGLPEATVNVISAAEMAKLGHANEKKAEPNEDDSKSDSKAKSSKKKTSGSDSDALADL